ncbi:AIPR family protein [Lactobacillaceae bacterium L1_55_11]|nr:AIPR family protein [Lactobacillaceae bacterium L1_55_11]
MITREPVKRELEKFEGIAKQYPELKDEKDENFFTLLAVWLVIKNTDEYNGLYIDKVFSEFFTNQVGDGGIDLIYPDVDDNSLLFVQTKFSENTDANEAVAEINKGMATVSELESNPNSLNEKLRGCYDAALNELADGDDIQRKMVFVSGGSFDKAAVEKRVSHTKNIDDFDLVIVNGDDLEGIIRDLREPVRRVNHDEVKIKAANNYSEYSSSTKEGIFTQVSAKSLKHLYDKYQDSGLFDLNVRKYIKKKSIDDEVKKTIHKHPDEFWFLNNGVTIATNAFRVDGNTIKLDDFSIVNGAQTTTLIATTLQDDEPDFYVPAKIIMPSEELSSEQMDDFFNQISEATNSQKPINPQDLKANSREMLTMKGWLKDYNIQLEIKRGIKYDRKSSDISIKNDVLAQLIYSFVNQMPGTARSKKKSLFDNVNIYKQIFRDPKYDQDRSKKDFIADLIRLNRIYEEVADELLKSDSLTGEQGNVIKNGKFTLFALLGVVYDVINGIRKPNELIEQHGALDSEEFKYGHFLEQEEFQNNLKKLILKFVISTARVYALQVETVGTMSNYLKKDSTYAKDIRRVVAEDLQIEGQGKYDDMYSMFKIK